MTQKNDILAVISPQEALAVLNMLTKNPEIRKRAEEASLALVGNVDINAVAEDVFSELDAIAIEDVWDNSGHTRDGYVEPGECAWQMFEDALAPFEEHLRRYHELSLAQQAKLQCMGILKGIWRFASEATSEFKDEAADAAGDAMKRIFDDWKDLSKNPKNIAEVKKFMDALDRKKTG